jgi:predicted MFS family arabinose efflux permease
MVEFGKKLENSIGKGRQEWSSYYIDYNNLKQILKQAKPKHQRASSVSNVPDFAKTTSFYDTSYLNRALASSSDLPASSTLMFRHALDQEIEKVVLFLLRQQGYLAKNLANLNDQRQTCQQQVATVIQQYHNNPAWFSEQTFQNSKKTLRNVCQDYRNTAVLVLEFIAYVEINVTAVRKILKKHDKNHHEDKQLLESYISRFTSQADSHLDQLYNYGGLSALVVTMKKAFWELHLMEIDLLQIEPQKAHRRIKSDAMCNYAHSEEDDLPPLRVVTTTAITTKHPHDALLLHHKLSMHSNQCSITSRNEPLLGKIYAARSRLKHSTKYVQVVAAQALMMFDDEGEDDSRDLQREETTRGQQISSFLNLCSTFLYLTNYYIVAPTSGQYADKLGSTEAMAGIIIGMTPNAALIATVLYGWWSNYSYKSALIFAAGCSMMGNVFYALALHQDSFTFVIIGRFFNGFGSARSINRRFIADTYSRSERTVASAQFVTAGALGMAAGPAIAAILGRFHFPEESLIWTVETSPGWVMLTLWSCFFLSAIFFFEEPDRIGLYGPKKPSNKADAAVVNTEMQPLLLSKTPNVSERSVEKKTPPPLYKNVPVMMTLWIYFVLKLALESLLSSSATVTKLYFGWNAQHTGTFLAFLGLLMFPANMVVARLSNRYEDRELLYVTLIIMFFSVLGILVYRPDHYSAVQYVFFGICVFLSANCLEGPNMSLLSKTIPRSWAKGTFNSGFLATEAGTAARSVGDIMISAAATLMGYEKLLNATFLPLMACILLSILLFRHFFEFMIEEEDDDESAEATIPSRQQSFDYAVNEQLKEVE